MTTPNSNPSSVRHPKFEFNQIGNAERLIHYHGAWLRYCTVWKKWLVWDGHRWHVDTNGAVNRKAHATIRAIKQDSKGIKKNDKLKDAMESHAKRSSTKYEIDAMVDIAKDLIGVSITPEELDANPMLLNCKNGVVDLRTGDLIPHTDPTCRGFLCTNLTPVKYQPGARCPQWEKFLDRIFAGDTALIEYVQRMIGYGLTGDVSEKALFFLHGEGDNGKTTMLEIVRRLLGPYAGMVQIETLMNKSQDAARQQAVARLYGKRMITASESEEGQRFQESTIKAITGMGRLMGRRLYENAFEFDPTHKLFIDANHKPDIRGTDHAIWTRMHLVPFGVIIPKAEQDRKLTQKLREELPGILAWAVRGAVAWQRDGLERPAAVERATEVYRSEMDIVSIFLTECCAKISDGSEGSTDLYSAFKNWCADAGNADPLTQTAFGIRLGKLGYQTRRSGAGNRWMGVRLTTPVPPNFVGGFAGVNLNEIDPEWEM